jgi:hypothetical protein
MASFTARDAANLVKKMPGFRDVSSGSVDLQASNLALDMMWQEHGWEDSLEDLPPFYLTPNEPYHFAPAVEIPADFKRLEDVWIRSLYGENQPLKIYQRLTPSGYTTKPDSISYVPEKTGFLLHPTPNEGWSGPLHQVVGVYKKDSPAVTQGNYNSGTMPWDDELLPVYLSALRWAYYTLLGSPQAGQVIWQAGTRQVTGELAQFYGLLERALFHEIAGQGPDFVAPENELALGGW